MTHQSRAFPARTDALPRVVTFIEEVCAAAGVDRPACLRLTLIVEELFTNTVRHGHGGDCDEPVTLALDVEPGRVALTYEDTAPPHDPFADVRPPDAAASVEERALGGLGVVLITGLAERLRYSYTLGRNRIWVLVSRSR